MIQRFSSVFIKPVLQLLSSALLALSLALAGVVASFSAVAAEADVAINVALKTAQTHTPGKVVAHELAEELVAEKGAGSGAEKTLQPVYRVKILNTQGVMKTLFVHRKSGAVVQ